MKITKLESLPNILKFKNKEDFTNRLIQQVITICKNDALFLKSNDRITKLDLYKKELDLKNEKLDSLLEKSSQMKSELKKKIHDTTESNKIFKEKLLNRLGGDNHENY